MSLRETRNILTLAIPLIIGQLTQMLLGVIDTMMVGHVGVTELATLTFANNLFIIPLVFGMGILTCVSVRTSTARGAEDPQTARNVCRNGIYLATICGIIFLAISLAIIPLFPKMGQPEAVASAAPPYFIIIMVSVIPCLMGIMLKNHADALDRPWPVFWINLAGVTLNVLLNYILIFGKFGLPAYGLIGAGIATLIARTAIVIATILWLSNNRSLTEWIPSHWLRKPDIAELKAQLHLGIPSGLQTLAEVSAFATAGLLIGHFGAAPLASHQIAIGAAGMAFMIPLGLSIALTIRIGETLANPSRQRSIVKCGWLLTLTASTTTAIIFMTAGQTIASWFIDAPHVIKLAASLLTVAGIFQIVDGIQVASAGMLRGLHDTRIPALIATLAYWLVGIPSGYFLAHHRQLGPTGIWWGLAIGLTMAAIPLSRRIWKKTSPQAS